MANYKDIITGTLGSLVEKVKGAAESGGVREIYEQGTSRAKAYAKIAKLTLELNGENEELKRVFAEIGKLYYEEAGNEAGGYFAPLFAQAGELQGKVDALQAEIDGIKDGFAASDEGDIDVEITEYDEIVSRDEEDK